MAKINATPKVKKSSPKKAVAVNKEVKPVVEETKRVSHLKLGPELLKAKATKEEIQAAFTKSFNARGVTNQDWINKRIAIYMNIARKKLALAQKTTAVKTA